MGEASDRRLPRESRFLREASVSEDRFGGCLEIVQSLLNVMREAGGGPEFFVFCR